MSCTLLFHGNNDCTNAPQCYVIRSLPFSLYLCCLYGLFVRTSKLDTRLLSQHINKQRSRLKVDWTVTNGNHWRTRVVYETSRVHRCLCKVQAPCYIFCTLKVHMFSNKFLCLMLVMYILLNDSNERQIYSSLTSGFHYYYYLLLLLYCRLTRFCFISLEL